MACVWEDKVVIVLADILVNGRSSATGIVVVTRRDDKAGGPTFDQVGYILFTLTGQAIIADHGKADALGPLDERQIHRDCASDGRLARCGA